NYAFKNGCISTISPGVFFYWTLVKAPSPNFTINVAETKDNPAFPFIPVMQGQVSSYDANCSTLASGVETSPGQSSVPVTGATAGRMYVGCIKYSLKALVGFCPPDSFGCHYDFSTQIGGVTVDKDPDGIQIGRPYVPPTPPTTPVPAPGDTVIMLPK